MKTITLFVLMLTALSAQANWEESTYTDTLRNHHYQYGSALSTDGHVTLAFGCIKNEWPRVYVAIDQSYFRYNGSRKVDGLYQPTSFVSYRVNDHKVRDVDFVLADGYQEVYPPDKVERDWYIDFQKGGTLMFRFTYGGRFVHTTTFKLKPMPQSLIRHCRKA